jgi:hypothetical protein
LFIGGSSIQIPQYALGFMLVAFFTILIFILVSKQRWLRYASTKTADDAISLLLVHWRIVHPDPAVRAGLHVGGLLDDFDFH